jgi:hypothetical protein
MQSDLDTPRASLPATLRERGRERELEHCSTVPGAPPGAGRSGARLRGGAARAHDPPCLRR